MKKFLLPTLGFSLFLSHVAPAAVSLIVSPQTDGSGVQLSLIGSLDITGIQWTGDGVRPIGDVIGVTTSGPRLFGNPGGNREIYTLGGNRPITQGIPNGAFTNLVMNLPTGLVLGSPGNPQLDLFGSFAVDDNLAPMQTVFDFDLSFDHEADIEEWENFSFAWDTNGRAAGGDTITSQVVPEPSTLFLSALTGLMFFRRRRHG